MARSAHGNGVPYERQCSGTGPNGSRGANRRGSSPIGRLKENRGRCSLAIEVALIPVKDRCSIRGRVAAPFSLVAFPGPVIRTIGAGIDVERPIASLPGVTLLPLDLGKDRVKRQSMTDGPLRKMSSVSEVSCHAVGSPSKTDVPRYPAL